MKTTPNLGLKKPDQEDFYNVDDFNFNADKLDEEVARRMINAGGVPSIQAGLDAEKPAPGTAGRIYVATDTQIIYLDTGSAWQKIGTGVVNWSDIAGKPTAFPPTAHKSTHAAGGSDPITPGDIGAASLTAANTFSSPQTAPQWIHNGPSDYPPFVVMSQELVTNLNADMVDGLHAASFARKDAAETIAANWTIGNNDLGVLKQRSVVLKIDTRTVYLTYDANGRLTKVEEKSGATVVRTTNLTYDASGRLSLVQDIAGGTTVTSTLSYDANGKLASVSKVVS